MIGRRHIIPFILLLVCCQSLCGQQANLPFREVKIPNSTWDIYSAAEDDEGFIWFGRFDGLYRFNGLNFNVYYNTPSDPHSLAWGRPLYVVKGRQDDMWVGTNTGGISRLDLKTYKFESIHNELGDPQSLGGNNVGGILPDENGIVWVGTNDFCLNRVDWTTKTVERFYPTITDSMRQSRQFSDYLGQIVQDPLDEDILWIGAAFGLLKFEKSSGKFTIFPYEAYNRRYKPTPVAVHVDDYGMVWAGSTEGLVRIGSGEEKPEIITILPNPEKPPIRGWLVTDIKQDQPDEILVATSYDGIFRVNTRTGENSWLDGTGEIGQGTNFILRDSRDILWITHHNYLYSSPPGWQRPGSIDLGKYPHINWSRAYLRGTAPNTIYVGTLNGVGLLYVDFNTGQVDHYSYLLRDEKIGDVFMQDLAWIDESAIAIASNGGLLKFSLEQGRIELLSDPKGLATEGNVTSVCKCRDELWFSLADEGVYSLHDGEFKLQIKDSEIGLVNDLGCNRDIICIGSDNGLFYYNPDAAANRLSTIISDFPVSEILTEDSVVVASTLGSGVFILKPMDGEPAHHFTTIGAGTNLVYHIARSENGNLWLNTDGGTLQYDPEKGEYTRYLEMGDGKRSPIIELEDGRIVSGGRRNITNFHPEDFKKRRFPPQIYITKIDIANRKEEFEVAPNRIQEITLQPSERELIIEFDATNFNFTSTTDFQYRLAGRDSSWINIGQQRYLDLNELHPGDYTLEIVGINAFGGSSEVPKRIELRVIPPLINRWWFRILIVLILAIVGWAMYRRSQKRDQKKLFESAVKYFANSHYAQNSVNEIVWDLARNVISRLNLEDCVIYLRDDNNCYVQVAAYGEKNPRGRVITNPLVIPSGQGIVGTAAESQEPSLVPDVTKDSRYIVDIKSKASELAVPIVHQGRTIGVIDSEHSKKGFFTQAHADVFSQIARESAHKIANAQAAEEIDKQERNLLNVQKEVAELKLTALQAQMNPHFIFNSLNSINWYILKNRPREASIYLTKFSKLVRLILDNSKSLSIPLDRELESLRLYLELESMRFEGSFNYLIQTDDTIDMEEVLIPPLILQPFVENAIWHGIMPKDGKGNILIQIYPEGENLKCIVQDDGIGRRAALKLRAADARPHESKGMKLTTDRIKLLHQDYLKDNMINIIDLVESNGEPAGTRVEVILPYD